ncbi:uncharacterized protein Dwil_GK10579, isoform A [Drosophila willistoni]|uniref:Uncharacterized protein, isoform A n=1 Tax=Drosophila willistoni TaxID=7260 RepID=B4NM16_DROWI|nr:uncharacterized protein Dwil_GK10579, isoform A [Drosophila willistoni]
MERYNRAWRDPRSPLTPLTPLTASVFNFDSNHETPTGEPRDRLYRSSRSDAYQRSHRPPVSSRKLTHGIAPRRFSQEFMRTRSVFSPHPHAQDNSSTRAMGNTTTKLVNTTTLRKKTRTVVKQETSGGTLKHPFKQGSPVEHPTLSPRVRSLLNRTNNEHLTEMFTRQEIDIQVLIQMTVEDLEALGVRGAKELKLIMEVIKFAKRFF